MAAGEKRIETRSWAPTSLRAGERVAIHAGKGLADMSVREFCELCTSEPFRTALVRARDRGLILPGTPWKLFPGDLPRGCIIAIAEFWTAYPTDSRSCEQAVIRSIERGAPHEREFGNYAPGRWAWVFVNVRSLTPPIQAKGALGLWEWHIPVEHVMADMLGAPLSVLR